MNDYDHFFAEALKSPNQSGKSLLVTEYEGALATQFNSLNAVAVNSGSAAIQTALQVLGAAKGKKVIVCATAPLPTLIPIAATGAEIVFVDCLSNSPNIDADKLTKCIDNNVVAVVEVPLWGYMQDYSETICVLNEYDIPLIEDAAHAHGSSARGKFAGTFGYVGCFSTHQMKLLSTGEGGFILTEESDLAERFRKFSRLGNLDGKTFGMNFKISAFTAAVGLARLKNFNSVLGQRRAARMELLSLLQTTGLCELSHIGNPNGYNVVIDIKDLSAPDFASALTEQGIALDTVKYGYKCGYKHNLFFDNNQKCENAESLIQRLVQLPTNTGNEQEIAKKLFDAINQLT